MANFLMTPEQQYTALKEIALKMSIEVREKNLHVSGIRVKSGFCKVRGRSLFILDKKKTLREKIALVAGCISAFDYMSTGISDEVLVLIDKYAGISDGLMD